MIKYSFYKRDKIYYVQIYFYGKRIQRSTGASTKKEAEKYTRFYLAELLKSQGSDYTFGHIVDQWVEYARINKSSFKGDIHRLKTILQYFGKETLTSEITPNKVQQFIYHLASLTSSRGKSYTKSTINRYIALLKVIFNHSIRMGLIDTNPVKVKKFKEIPRKHYYSEDEVKRMLQAVNKIHQEARTLIQYTFKYVFIIALMTGMRLSEILNLKWEDLKDNCFYIYNNKERAEKFVPIPQYLKVLLLELKKEGDIYIIPMNRRSPDAIRKTWTRVQKIANVSGRFHDLRRTYAVQLMNLDVSLRIIQNLLGHQDITTTQVYTPDILSLKQKVVDKLKLPVIDTTDRDDSKD
jgi:integrase/recombinase XerD